ncbi:hypothetical protein LEP1GSC185_0620 [Leptospira licerasiae serovar Varillal str. VAR 010]|nr:hypothetical protein LEP1GSC185_0620 [Leptospira licerasiae serovar Varillal str. VAR 010]
MRGSFSRFSSIPGWFLVFSSTYFVPGPGIFLYVGKTL